MIRRPGVSCLLPTASATKNECRNVSESLVADRCVPTLSVPRCFFAVTCSGIAVQFNRVHETRHVPLGAHRATYIPDGYACIPGDVHAPDRKKIPEYDQAAFTESILRYQNDPRLIFIPASKNKWRSALVASTGLDKVRGTIYTSVFPRKVQHH